MLSLGGGCGQSSLLCAVVVPSENEDGRKNLRFEGYGVYSLEGRKSLELCLVRLYRADDGFQGKDIMDGVRKGVDGCWDACSRQSKKLLCCSSN
ncbi:unnamed protein product [Prunus brigantina]